MKLIDRAKNILLTPKTEWDVVATETTPVAAIVTGYILPLAAIAAIAQFISFCVIGTITPLGTFRMGIGWGVAMMVYQFVMYFVAVFVAAAIIDFLAPTFGATKGFDRAFRVAAYTYTAAWIGAVLGIIPWLGMLLGLLLALYSIYLLYLGLPRVMKNPPEKSPGYTALVVVVAIVVGIVIGLLGGLISGPAMMAGMAARAPGHVTYDKNSGMGKLQDFGKKMEEANKKMEAAQKSGDTNKQMAAAMGALGTVMSGGKGVEPVQLDALKPLLPETVAGLPRTSSRADRSGVAGLMSAKVANTYSDNAGRRIELEVMDTGGAAGLIALAGLAMGESETDSRIERTRREGDRLVREEISKRGGTNSYTVVLKDRFVVSGKGSGVDIDTVKSAVASLDLGKVESLK